MTLTIESLAKIYDEAYWRVMPGSGDVNRHEGIRAVVEALAPDDDEIAAYNRLSYKVREQLKCECDYLPEDRCIRCSVMEALKCLETRFNDILGGAGDQEPKP